MTGASRKREQTHAVHTSRIYRAWGAEVDEQVRRKVGAAYARIGGQAEQEVPVCLRLVLLVAGNALHHHIGDPVTVDPVRPANCRQERCQNSKEGKAEEQTVRGRDSLPDDLHTIRVRRRRNDRSVERRPARCILQPLSAVEIHAALHGGCVRGDDGGSWRVYACALSAESFWGAPRAGYALGVRD
jgi:hypothetical protein